MKLNLAATLLLFFGIASPISCLQAVNCRWGLYGDWSECDGCTKTKVRTRPVEVYAQFGGSPCLGEATETQPCVPEKTCPLDTGCGGRFRCTSGQCISQTLVCNGDQDCVDGLDERNCDRDDSQYSCDLQKTPPNSDITGRGYDALTGKLKAGVINTLSFGGQCRKAYSGDHKTTYRLPENIIKYSFDVQVNNEESDESFENSWSYIEHIQSEALVGHDRRTFHKEVENDEANRIIILKNKVKLAQFQNSAPKYLSLSESFWKALSSLPLTYDYSAYRQLLQTYGTHYLSEGSLGGEYQGLLELDRQAFVSSSTTDIEYQRCWKKVKRYLFVKKVKITCESLKKVLEFSSSIQRNKMPIKVKVFGGNPALIAPLSILDLENPEANGQVYSEWASSVKDFPDVLDQKLEPLYELVKEVQCAGLKKLLLKRATEEYLAEEHPCHCRPCQNNGRPLLTGTECRCVCRPGTSGPGCEIGAVIGEQQGVVHGSWSCWSSWGSCSGGKRTRARRCNNPAPARGGNNCIGMAEEQEPCEEPDTEYLKTMEPQCFGMDLTPPKTCGLPPHLKNGYIQSPRDFYLVGHMVEYSCIGGYYLDGNSVAACKENQTWNKGSMVCKRVTCGIPQVNNEIKVTPFQEEYRIGESVFLSCPAGFTLDRDESEVMCNPSLQWSPAPQGIHCKPVPTAPPLLGAGTCKLWETPGKRGCVCKMPFECGPSLPLCASIGPKHRLLDACKVGSLLCRGQRITLAKDSDCTWPEETFKSCEACKPGTVCQESERNCICQNASDCPKDSTPLCVSLYDGLVMVTMTECEAGAKRCVGEQLNVISLEACNK